MTVLKELTYNAEYFREENVYVGLCPELDVSSFGGWKGLIDAEGLRKNIYEDRLISTRPVPEL